MSGHTTLLHIANLCGVRALRSLALVVAVLLTVAVGADRASATYSRIKVEKLSPAAPGLRCRNRSKCKKYRSSVR